MVTLPLLRQYELEALRLRGSLAELELQKEQITAELNATLGVVRYLREVAASQAASSAQETTDDGAVG